MLVSAAITSNPARSRLDVEIKDIKNLHLSVYPPSGKVGISDPLRMSLDAIHMFAISRLGWIKKRQKKLREQQRETPREYLERESHYLWGKRYLLRIGEADAPPKIELIHSRIILQVRPGTDANARQIIMAKWYRDQIKAEVPALVAKWAPMAGVNVKRIFVRKMKTKRGQQQSPDRLYPLKYGSRKKTARMPGIYRGPRYDSPESADA